MKSPHFELLGSTYQPSLLISDIDWWEKNQTMVMEWMNTVMPRDSNRQVGMVLNFATEQERMMFMLRWG